MQRKQRFVVDGYRRARTALEPTIRAQVETEYAERLKGTNVWQHFWLTREIEGEITRRIVEKVPRDGLY